MRPASPALIAFLMNSTSFLMADLYTLTLNGLGAYRYSGGQTAVVANANTYQLGPKFSRSKIQTVIGTKVGELDVTIYPEPADTVPPNIVNATPLLQAAWRGQLDGAAFLLERAFLPSWGAAPVGTVTLFGGRVSDIDCSRTQLVLKVRSYLELLNIQMPRRIWDRNCTHIFGGPMCLFDRTTLSVDIAALAGSAQSLINTSFTPSPTTLYDQGSIIGIAGQNAGQTCTIVTLANGVIKTLPQFLFPVMTGDVFQLLPGCPRTQQACDNLFNNRDPATGALRFGGFPYVPTPETSI